MDPVIISAFSAFFALISLIISGINSCSTEKKFRDTVAKGHIDEIRNGIIEVHKLAVNAVIYSGDVSNEHCESAVLSWEDLRARANEKWELGSLEAQRILTTHLVEFTKQCVNEDLVEVVKSTPVGEQRLDDMLTARLQLIDAFKTMSKRVKPKK